MPSITSLTCACDGEKNLPGVRYHCGYNGNYGDYGYYYDDYDTCAILEGDYYSYYSSYGAYHCNDGYCIPGSWQCDGVMDCCEGEDEIGCSNSYCGYDEYACPNGICISNSQFCDGINDCGDYSDEYCDPGYYCDSAYSYQCSNGGCIDSSWFCDGYDDCGDNSDEEYCYEPPTNSFISCNYGDIVYKQEGYQPNLFKCDNYYCIFPSQVCNGVNDCGDNSDEPSSCYVTLEIILGSVGGVILLISIQVTLCVLVGCCVCAYRKKVRMRGHPVPVSVELEYPVGGQSPPKYSDTEPIISQVEETA